LVINPLSKRLLEAAKNPYAGMQTSGLDVAYFIAGKGEEAVIAGSVSPQAYSVLTQFGIRVFGGYKGRVKDAIGLYRQARISQGLAARKPMAGTPVAFGFGKQAFTCPACNWRLKTVPQGNAYPNCPNCGLSMARNMSNQGWRRWFEENPFARAANTRPIQNSLNGRGAWPNFWQGPESAGFFTCPKCNWRMYAQSDQFPRCPNCRAIMAKGNLLNQNYQNFGFNAQGAAFTNPISALPIYPNATMPHGYRGVCSSCHQILKGSQRGPQPQGAGATQAGWVSPYGGGICILR
jgi:predicted Fe-Mo cluster-binding NifX family protein/transcription elongation factor Elf1